MKLLAEGQETSVEKTDEEIKATPPGQRHARQATNAAALTVRITRFFIL